MGIMIAGVCLSLSKYLAMPVLDSIGSISIGLLLGSVAIFLVRRNVASLLETSMPAERQKQIERILETDPVIRYWLDKLPLFRNFLIM
jgi:zinc transporter 9